MDDKKFALLGVIGPMTAYIFTGISIALSPWFSWWTNALSDLGHSSRSSVAPIYNFGLLLTGFLIAVYAITVLKRHSRYTSICLTLSAFMLQMVATFDEVYRSLHQGVSTLFFVCAGITLLVYAMEKKSLLTIIAFIIGFSSWILHWARVYSSGIAIPEIISATAVASWIMLSALRIYFGK